VKKTLLVYDKSMHEARKYWRDRLETISFDRHIGLDHPHPNDGQPQSSSLEGEFDADVHTLLRRLTAGNLFLFHTTLIIALRICCYKYSGESKVTVFSPAPLGGGAGDLLPIGGMVDSAASFKDALLATKNLLSTVYGYQQYPLACLLLDMPAGLRPKQLPMIVATVAFNETIPDTPCEIAVLFETNPDKTSATFRFDNRLYEESTVSYFFRSLNSILRQGLGEMASRIRDLRPDCEETPGSGEDSQRAPVLATPAACIHRMIEAQSAEQPDAHAIVEGDRVTTYGMLNRHADQLAQALANLRVDLARPIVIMMNESSELIVSMLAVMKIGAAFALAKPRAGHSGIADVVGALHCECIIFRRENATGLDQPSDPPAGVKHSITIGCPASADGDDGLSLDISHSRGPTPLHAAGDGQARDIDRADDRPRNAAACCILVDNDLSSSLLTEEELVSLFQWLNQRCGIGAHDRCTLLSGLGFSEQLYDTLGMLIRGASVEIVDPGIAKDASRLAEHLLTGKATVWHAPTALVQNMLASLAALRTKRPNPRGPRTILLVGEKQCSGLAGKLTRLFPEARVTGLYTNSPIGPWTTVFALDDNAADANGAAIGQPIPGYEHRVLNKSGELAPPHTSGALHLRRVLNVRQAITQPAGLRAERLEGAHFRWLRGDDHCYMRSGYRVELTALEAALCRHEDIRAAEVTIIRTEHEPDGVAVAFIVADADRVSAETVRNHLVLQDNADLVPDRVIVMDQFPLGADGVIDRGLLVKRYLAWQETEYGARNIEADGIHRRLKIIWLEALQLEDVDDDDSFFAHGGNSLKATLLMARVRDEFSVELSVQDFFRKPTMRAITQLILAELKNVKSRLKVPDFKAISREKYRMQLSETEG
jgi:non-ribosomal peptide synthetase component F/acyl carrier protein